MMSVRFIIITISVVGLVLGTSSAVLAEHPEGTFKVGYVYTDEEGNQGVYQPGYNLYEGLGLSLEDFSYHLSDGSRIFGDFKNITLNNRNLLMGAAKTGLYNLKLRHSEYRRTYSFDGDKSTRRLNSHGDFWVQAHKNVRLFGGYGQINKNGRSLDLFEPTGFGGAHEFDFTQKYFNAGARIGYERSFLELEYRGNDFDDALNQANQRNMKQFRATGSAPVPRLHNFYVNGGYQHYQLAMRETDDSLKANTGWGGVRYFNENGFNIRYSFIWDRARRTTDLTATDHITNAVYLGKDWVGSGGITIGYRHKINDDFLNEVASNGYFFSAWAKPHSRLTLRVGYGSEFTDVLSGATLTGDRDFNRYSASAAYKFRQGTWRVKVEDKTTENFGIGSKADFTRAGTDVTFTYEKYGDLQFAYDYLNGENKNVAGKFKFSDHVLWGNFLSSRYHNCQLGAGGTYRRSRQDLDVESFSVRFSGNYAFGKGNKVELAYAAHNYDDFNDPAPIYSRYYTANVVELSFSREF